MNDKDKHEMRLLQELYLEDGELGGGEKRKRNFRWRNIDENFNENSQSHEIDEADNYSEMREKNEELLQRNKFLMERDEVWMGVSYTYFFKHGSHQTITNDNFLTMIF